MIGGITALNNGRLESGIGVYAKNIMNILGEENVFSYVANNEMRSKNFPGTKLYGYKLPITTGWYLNSKYMNLVFRLKRYETNKIVHYLAPTILPLKKKINIVTFHDLYYLYDKNRYHKAFSLKHMQDDYIIASSNTTKGSLVNEGFDQEKISMIHMAIQSDKYYQLGNRDDIKRRFKEEHGIKRPIVMTEGDRQHKNSNLVHELIKDDCFHIHIGKNNAHLNFTNVSDVELNVLYNIADCFIRLSEYEGFGLPPIESIFSGTPSIVSPIPIFKEIFKDTVHYYIESDSLTSQILKVIDERESWLSKFVKIKDHFKTERFESDMIKFYQSLLREISP